MPRDVAGIVDVLLPVDENRGVGNSFPEKQEVNDDGWYTSHRALYFYQLTGLTEKLQENPIFHGKINGFL